MSTVLVALHYQNEVLHPAGRIKVGVAKGDLNQVALVARAQRLLALARQSRIPVVSVRIAFRADHADVIQNCSIFRNVVAGGAMVENSWGTEFHDGLGPANGEFVVKHGRVNAFHGSQLEETLRCLGADHLVIAGVSTNSVVATTVACAADMGYRVTVIGDCCSSGSPSLHAACLENMRLVADVIDLETFVTQTELEDSRP
ncbi:MAG: cysteine hydrolase [Mesorhizobium amorphae]|nr:MAG: cysteine hydrolase [Mesorhizobium amorphae]